MLLRQGLPQGGQLHRQMLLHYLCQIHQLLRQLQVQSYFQETSPRNEDGSNDDNKEFDKEKKRIKVFRTQLGKNIFEFFVLKGDCYYNAKNQIKIEVIDPDMPEPFKKT